MCQILSYFEKWLIYGFLKVVWLSHGKISLNASVLKQQQKYITTSYWYCLGVCWGIYSQKRRTMHAVTTPLWQCIHCRAQCLLDFKGSTCSPSRRGMNPDPLASSPRVDYPGPLMKTRCSCLSNNACDNWLI